MTRKTPARLHKIEQKKPKLHDIKIMELWIILALLLLLLIFMIICFVTVPRTYGFFVW